MLTKSELLAFLQEGQPADELKQAEQILDEELEKPVDELDAELVESCVQTLLLLRGEDPAAGCTDVPKPGIMKAAVLRRRRFHLKRLAAIAAAITLTVSVLFTSATAFHSPSPIFEQVVIEDAPNVWIDVDKLLSVSRPDGFHYMDTKLGRLVASAGMDEVLLPGAVLGSNEYELVNYAYQAIESDPDRGSFQLLWRHGAKRSHLIISSDFRYFMRDSRRPIDPDYMERYVVKTNGIEILVFQYRGEIAAYFSDGKYLYTFRSSLSLPNVLAFLETIA